MLNLTAILKVEFKTVAGGLITTTILSHFHVFKAISFLHNNLILNIYNKVFLIVVWILFLASFNKIVSTEKVKYFY
jgi:hypothetical protein